VKRQFHHIKISITENNYWGTKLPQIEPIHSVSRQQTARWIFEVLNGRATLGGKRAKTLMEEIDKLRSSVEGLTKEAAWAKTITWTERNGIFATHDEHGMCVPVVGSEMTCHLLAGTRPLGHLHPNYVYRAPHICARCPCFSYTADGRHLTYWYEEYIENTACARQKLPTGAKDVRRICKANAADARNFLVAAGIDLSSLEHAIDERVRKHAF
jgi:hypothetical protein